MKNLLFTLATIFVTATAANAQCKNTHTYCNLGKDKGFKINNQSKSGVIAKGEEYEVSIIVYKDVDYRIAFCSDDEELEGKIEFEIYEILTEKRYDEKKKKDMYVKVPNFLVKSKELVGDDGAMVQELEFNSTKTRKLYIKIYVPEGASEGGKRRKGLGSSDSICMGILVQHQKGLKMGF